MTIGYILIGACLGAAAMAIASYLLWTAIFFDNNSK